MRILDGTYPAGTRLTETAASEDLGVSRTPVRIAFRALEKEGYLDPAGARGYAVRQVTHEDVSQALQLRGILEAEAARRLAENGLTPETDELLTRCVSETSKLFKKGYIDHDDAAEFNRFNEQFHNTLLTATGDVQLQASIRRLSHLPAGPLRSINFKHEESRAEYLRLFMAHTQHCIVLRAIKCGDTRRAEAVMREHAFVRIDYLSILSETLSETSGEQLAAK